MKLKIPIFFIAIILSTFFFHSFAYAEDTQLLVTPGVRDTSEDGALFSDDKMAQMKKDKDDATLTDGILLGFILSIFDLKISSLPTLIFGNPYGDTENLDFGIFTKDEMSKIIDPILAMMTGIYVTILTAAIMISAARFGVKAYSPQAKSDFWTDVNMWVLSAFFMACFWLIFKVMMSINVSLVISISDLLKSNGIDTNGVSLVASAGNFNVSNAIVYLCEFGLTLYLNVIYIARKVIITFLVVLAPFAAYSMLFAKTRAFFGTWLKELAGNIFLQSIHGIAIYILTMFASLATVSVFGTIYKLGLLIMFIPITGMMSRWMNLGDSSTKIGQAATVAGVGSVAGAMMLAKGAGGMMGGRRGGSLPSSGSDGRSSGSGGSTPDHGNDSGTTALSKAAAGGSGWQRMRSVAGAMGAVAGGAMGLTMGPAGVAIGAKAGSVLGSTSAQGARNAFAGMANISRTTSSAMLPKGIKESYQNAAGNNFFDKVQDMATNAGKNLKDTWGNLGERRRFMGNLGESIGNTVGAGGFGRQMGHMLSGASRGRVQGASAASGGMNNMALPQLAQKYAGQNVSWEQTNSGSAFYADTASGKQRISNFGAADPNLAKGETRVASYQFPSANQKFERQPNGSYRLPSAQSGPPGMGGFNNNAEGPVGLPGGSNEHLVRTSGAFIRGTDGSKFEDNRMDASKLSPDSYFSHNIQGADRRDWSDKGADFLSRKTSANTKYTPPSNHAKKLEGMANQVKHEKTRTKNKMIL